MHFFLFDNMLIVSFLNFKLLDDHAIFKIIISILLNDVLALCQSSYAKTKLDGFSFFAHDRGLDFYHDNWKKKGKDKTFKQKVN